MATARTIEVKARQLALGRLNDNRARSGHPPLGRIPKSWWTMFGGHWVAVVKQAEESKSRTTAQARLPRNPCWTSDAAR